MKLLEENVVVYSLQNDHKYLHDFCIYICKALSLFPNVTHSGLPILHICIIMSPLDFCLLPQMTEVTPSTYIGIQVVEYIWAVSPPFFARATTFSCPTFYSEFAWIFS